jgi:phospholipid transport system transporter-binding protein
VSAAARFEIQGARAEVSGELVFSTVGDLLRTGSAAIRGGQIHTIDLAGVVSGDSAGLALLIEWLSIARAASSDLKYTHLPSQLHQLAALSDVDELLGDAAPTA